MKLRRYKKKKEWTYTLNSEVNGMKTEDAHYKFKKIKDAIEKPAQ